MIRPERLRELRAQRAAADQSEALRCARLAERLAEVRSVGQWLAAECLTFAEIEAFAAKHARFHRVDGPLYGFGSEPGITSATAARYVELHSWDEWGAFLAGVMDVRAAL